MTGKEAYKEDVRRSPLYHDGSPRKAWDQLGEAAQWSWSRNPVPREYSGNAQTTSCESERANEGVDDRQ